MKRNEKAKEIEEKSESMSTVDEGLNVIVQAVNNATGLDKGNDGKMNNND